MFSGLSSYEAGDCCRAGGVVSVGSRYALFGVVYILDIYTKSVRRLFGPKTVVPMIA